jgi:hypothetical protein
MKLEKRIGVETFMKRPLADITSKDIENQLEELGIPKKDFRINRSIDIITNYPLTIPKKLTLFQQKIIDAYESVTYRDEIGQLGFEVDL